MDNNKIYIGIDVGTSSIKILGVNILGEILHSVTKSYKTLNKQPLYSEQNPEDWYNNMLIGLEEMGRFINFSNVEALSFSGQMHGMVLIDDNNNVIRPAILWNDQRTAEECNYLNEHIGIEKLIDYTGNVAITGFTAPKIMWIKKNEPENFKKIKKILLPKDYLVYKLTGKFATDYSDASGTLYFNVKEKVWSEEMIEILKIKKDNLPDLYDSSSIIGEMKEEIKKILGIQNNIKVVIGGGDQAVAAIGGGVVGENTASISLGTSGVVFVNTKEFSVDNGGRLHSFCNANKGYHMMGVTLCAANSLKWWVERAQKNSDYDDMLRGVSNNLKNEIIFLPYLSGERTPHNDPNAKGIFWGLDISSTREDMTKAILEGVAFSLRDCLELMENKCHIEKIIVNGGGSKSIEWCEVLSDVLKKPVVIMNSQEGPALGAAILAMVGNGEYETVEDAVNKILHESKIINPDLSNEEYYDKKYIKYKKVYKENKDLFINN